VIKEAGRDPALAAETCVTAQHREMLDQMLDVFAISPDHDLDLMQGDQSLFTLTSGALVGPGRVLEKVNPDLVIVQGDTTTTMAAALAAYYLRIPVGHVEAGLRTFQRYAPFPEEVNRRIATVVAELHFAPTEWARGNLLREDVDASRIFVVGNTVGDAVLAVAESLDRSAKEDLDLGPGRLILVTAHRRESLGRLEEISTA
jgi:UDP-N-acetylglucosamine 2-epimerase (non-hydrolysing)